MCVRVCVTDHGYLPGWWLWAAVSNDCARYTAADAKPLVLQGAHDVHGTTTLMSCTIHVCFLNRLCLQGLHVRVICSWCSRQVLTDCQAALLATPTGCGRVPVPLCVDDVSPCQLDGRQASGGDACT